MPAASLLALIDDIATVLDDVSLLTKVAAKKTAGVLGDDLALNAEQVSGVRVERELPVVWAVAKGSLVNKAILIPAALAISALLPWLITPLLMVGGAYLCFEGFEKVWHKLAHPHAADEDDQALHQALSDPKIDLLALEKEKVRGAIRTDFILSAEIITITLGSVAGAALLTQLSVLIAVALLLTVGVYGLVAGIVKMDDAGLALSRMAGDSALAGARRRFGLWLLNAAPWLMKFLGVAGTIAMFLVGGGILAHGWPWLHHVQENLAAAVPGLLSSLVGMTSNFVAGIIAGGLILLVLQIAQRLRGRSA